MKQSEVKKWFESLKENDLIKPNSYIQVNILMALFQCNDRDDFEKYRVPLIVLKDHIEKHTGYRCKTENLGLKIYGSNDSHYFVQKYREDSFRKLKKAERLAKNTPVDEITGEDNRRKHFHQTNIILMLNKNLKDFLKEI